MKLILIIIASAIILIGDAPAKKCTQTTHGDSCTECIAETEAEPNTDSITDSDYESEMQSSTVKFVKTGYRCKKCSCSGYWGYKHLNGTYEGNCMNTDKYGHRCGHSPQHHGLRKW